VGIFKGRILGLKASGLDFAPFLICKARAEKRREWKESNPQLVVWSHPKFRGLFFVGNFQPKK